MRDQTYRHPVDEEVTLNENAFVDLLACSGGCDFAADSYCESATAADLGCVSAIGLAFAVLRQAERGLAALAAKGDLAEGSCRHFAAA